MFKKNCRVRYVKDCITKSIIILFCSGILLFISCDEEEKSFPGPVIQFRTDTGYTYKDKTVQLNESAAPGDGIYFFTDATYKKHRKSKRKYKKKSDYYRLTS